ncbi:MAG: F0F1 ATP synthase subunit A [Bacteroidetes bacterium]|nr:F0F1 ATP synthase subunit A [Bacteroidota bacterium]
MYIRLRQILLILILINPFILVASEGEKEEEGFNLVNFALHHIADSYSWDFYHKKDGTAVGIKLPRILVDLKNINVKFYLSTQKALENGCEFEHEFNHNASHGTLLFPNTGPRYLELKKAIEEKSTISQPDKIQQKEIKSLKRQLRMLKPLDFSITKNVLFMLFAGILLLWVFISIANKYKRNPNVAPSGLQSALEPIIVFVRDDIAKTYIPHKYERFLPLLLNFFFFIWFLNMMGLVPFSGNVTGNIAVTASLALITFFATNINGKKNYWQHIFWYPGVPIPVKFILLVVEFVSIFTKPFALAIRLFANITAGHLVILAFISLIFMFGKSGEALWAGVGTSFLSVGFALFIDMIEILIALLQAYIFTTLSALFIGQAVETEH